MKQITNMSRLVNQLEKMFRALNADLFDNALATPIITVIPTPKAYAHYVPYDIWDTKDDSKREINIASGTLNRPLENILASLLHEMVHMYNDTVLNIQDTSRNGTYHNKAFATACREHGLICTKTEKYGWSHTEPDDTLLEWLLNHNELREIEMCRTDTRYMPTGIGSRSASGGIQIITTAKGNSRRYICPCCHTIVRATRIVNIVCGDCAVKMIEG